MSTFESSRAPAEDEPANRLFTELYRELQRIAHYQLSRSAARSAATSESSLLHEAYVAIRERQGLAFPDKAHFIAYAARVMRNLLIDRARQHAAQKRGSGWETMQLTHEIAGSDPQAAPELVDVNKALEEVAQIDPYLAQLVDLKVFCGFSLQEIAAMFSISTRTAERHWSVARALLRGRLQTLDQPRPQ